METQIVQMEVEGEENALIAYTDLPEHVITVMEKEEVDQDLSVREKVNSFFSITPTIPKCLFVFIKHRLKGQFPLYF